MFHKAPNFEGNECTTSRSGVGEQVGQAGEKAVVTPEWESLKPLRNRGPREEGNKIEIKKPATREKRSGGDGSSESE